MAVLRSVWIIITLSIFQVSQAFYPIRSPPCLPGFPRHESTSSCRETIEDLKALLEITQALQPNQSYTCPACSSTFSEEIILKLVNALIYSATQQNCGSSHVSGGGTHTGGISGGSGNSGGVIGGVIGGGINPGIVIGGGNTGPVGGSSNSGGISSPGHGRGVPISGPNKGNNDDGLIQVGLLDGEDTAHVDIAGKKILGVDVGPQPGSGGGAGGSKGGKGTSNDGLINLGVLPGGNDLLDLGLGGTKVLGVDLGPPPGAVTGGSTGNNGGNKPGTGKPVTSQPSKPNPSGTGSPGTSIPPQPNPSGTGNPGTSQPSQPNPPGTGNPVTGQPSGTGNPGISQPSQPNYGNTINYSPNTVPIANSNANTVTTPVHVETIVYNAAESLTPGNTGKVTDDGNNGFEGMAMPVIGD